MLKRLGRMLLDRMRRFEKSERGVAAIEFALLAPPFFLVLGAICETGLMFFAEYTIQTAVQDSARLVRTGQAQTTPLSSAQFKTKICGLVSLMLDCSGGVTVYVRSDTTFAALAANMDTFLNIGPSTSYTSAAPTCYGPGAPSQPAAVVATYDWKFNMLGMSAMGNLNGGASRRLVGFAIFQNEPFPSSGSQSKC